MARIADSGRGSHQPLLSARMSRLNAAVLLALFAAANLCGDVITPKKGPPFRGTVVSIDEKSVTVKTESETRVIERSAIRKIELGDALMTGMQGQEYTNADYRLRVSMPPGWAQVAQEASDFAARKSPCSVTFKGLSADESVAGEVVIKGAINGMKTNVPGSEFSNLVDTTFSGIEFRRSSLKAPTVSGVTLFCPRGRYVMMFLTLSESKARSAEACLADWENKIRFVEE
jgi:hypothetical protein